MESMMQSTLFTQSSLNCFMLTYVLNGDVSLEFFFKKMNYRLRLSKFQCESLDKVLLIMDLSQTLFRYSYNIKSFALLDTDGTSSINSLSTVLSTYHDY